SRLPIYPHLSCLVLLEPAWPRLPALGPTCRAHQTMIAISPYRKCARRFPTVSNVEIDRGGSLAPHACTHARKRRVQACRHTCTETTSQVPLGSSSPRARPGPSCQLTRRE